jgi:hypothetical protein
MQLKRGLRPLWRSDFEAQIGTDQRVCLRIELEDPREHAMLAALERDHTLPQLRGILIRAGADPQRADALAGTLRRAGLLRDREAHSHQFRLPADTREMFAPAAETRAILGRGDGWEPQGRLAAATVDVYGLGRTGARIAAALACAGVGRLRLIDQRRVESRDCGSEYGAADVGQPRQAALERRIRELPGGCQANPRRGAGQPHAAILVDYEVADLLRGRELLRADIPHFAVVVGDASIECGPWVAPGRTACLRCLALRRAARDPAWPALATQRAARSAVAARGEDPALAALAGAHAAAQVIAALTGDEPACANATYDFRLPDYAVQRAEWAPHADCGCRGPLGGRVGAEAWLG